MMEDYQNKTIEELVDILAQKTQKFTQLLVYKEFGNEYRECKETIRYLLAQIELKKVGSVSDQSQASSAPAASTTTSVS